MSARMSNSERIARMAEEAEIARKEKEAAAEAKKNSPAPKKASSRKAASKSTGRTKFVWVVKDQRGSDVKTYPYPEEKEARADAERLSKETGKPHFVTRTEVPFE